MNRGGVLVAFVVPAIAATAQVVDTATTDLARMAGRSDRIPGGYEGIFPLRHERSLEFLARGFFDSNVLYNDLMLALRRSDLISDTVRQRSLEALGDRNRVGQEVEGRVTFTGGGGLFGRAHWKPMISAAYRSLTGSRFTRDAYDLTFFGNSGHENDTLLLAPSALERQTWWTLGAGVLDDRTGSYLRLDVVLGEALDAVDLDRAEFHTATDGRVLSADVEGRYVRSDTGAAGPGAINGGGLSLSGRIQRPFIASGLTCSWLVEIEDLGFIRWPDALALRKDSAAAYEGIEVENVFDVSDVVIGEEELLDTLGGHAGQRVIVRALPVKVIAGVEVRWSGRWNTRFTLDQRDLPGYMPHAEARTAWRAADDLLLDAGIGAGGFGGLRFGFGTAIDLGGHLRLSLRCANVIGTLNEEARGMAAEAGITMAW